MRSTEGEILSSLTDLFRDILSANTSLLPSTIAEIVPNRDTLMNVRLFVTV